MGGTEEQWGVGIVTQCPSKVQAVLRLHTVLKVSLSASPRAEQGDRGMGRGGSHCMY